MKTIVLTVATMLCAFGSNTQELNIETKSVSIDQFISFIVNNIERKSLDSPQDISNMVFLLQTSEQGIGTEEKVILRQGFKLISERLTEDDFISILTYSGFNGVALQQSSPKEMTTIAYTLEHLKPSVKEFHEDGIELAYQYTTEHFLEDAINTIVMIRNPYASSQDSEVSQNTTSKKKNNAVLITAMALLPELISVIKD
ncbi:hypothetical protein AB9K26_10030 [Psychroserpens sp. XS_ASV72]|uniref:hypothetical protein n=1 Tax=Psychroserpens sp. XS_ASV72 TaxID=3241293 RepID=UPI003512535B